MTKCTRRLLVTAAIIWIWVALYRVVHDFQIVLSSFRVVQ